MTELPDIMLAVRCGASVKPFRLDRVPVPRPGKGVNLVRKEACGLAHDFTNKETG
ncbi:hypothetical protein [Sediminimonas qiaohouensis]|uniref:hypothetical protein n=1 Tax=Sediminimonas qiaohouensis TaxID=552061 RepID=UPI002356B47D|nr:hypothetical protein [Sediminimonas qiaohouensis]